MDVISLVSLIQSKKSGGGGSDFPVNDFFAKTVTELDLKGVTVLGQYSVNNQAMLTKLLIPDVVSIASQGISSCSILESVTLPKSLKTLSGLAFMSNAGLKTITFEGVPESISTSAFYASGTIKTINVPWSEGEVAGAPWGATSAQINYNYTGG